MGPRPNTAAASWPGEAAGRASSGGAGGLSLAAVAAASVASVSAALITSRVWGQGTLLAAALSPVIVAVVTELLKGSGRRFLDLPHRLKLGLLTAIVAFAVGATLLTTPELITGKSLAGGDRATTYFGGKEKTSSGSTAAGEPAPGQAPAGGGEAPGAPGGPVEAPLLSEGVSFGQTTVGGELTGAVQVTNPNSTAISLSGAEVVDDGSPTSSPGDFSQDGACSTVAARATCSITVTFRPQTAEPTDGVQAGVRTALLRFSDDGTGNARTVPLVGEVILPADASAE
jgi:hypothetical protein